MTNRSEFRRRSVAAGDYVIDNKSNLILDAHLGTCVGVTICDREANVGGLLHLLLPEWTGIDKPWKPVTYATTGLPMFLKALCEAGASVERMEACVAGGALVGPVTQLDLDLDVGGRTEDIVQGILREDGISVVETETGGYFSCRLSLDMNTFDTTIHPMGHKPISKLSVDKKLIPEDISTLLCQVRPIPQVALKILRMIQDQDYDMRMIAEEIKQDQVISAGVLRLCNSAFVGMKQKIESIDRALVILGEKLLLQMVISASVELFFSDSVQGYSLCKGGLFRHALSVALVAEKLAEFTNRASANVAYTAGLLHDIGKVILDQYMAAAYPYFYRRTQVEGVDLCEVEKDKFGYSHAEAGGMLADAWSLPDSLIDAIRCHHCPEQSENDTQLTHLVYLADLLTSRFQVDQELDCLNMDQFALRLEHLGLAPSQFPILVDLMPSKIFDTSSNGDCLLPTS